MAKTVADVMKMVKENEVKFVDFRFTDTRGKEQHVSVPVSAFDEDKFTSGTLRRLVDRRLEGHRSLRHAADARPDHRQHRSVLRRADAAADLRRAGPDRWQPYERDPRSLARRAEAYLKASGLGDTAYFGPEPEFFIFDSVRWGVDMSGSFSKIEAEEAAWNTGKEYEHGNNGYRPTVKGGYFPVPPVDSGQDLRSEMCLILESLGIPVEVHHHEVANAGQMEIGTKFSSLVQRADWLQLQKYVIQNVAHAYGKTATFMPKPIVGDNGSGMHVHQSVWKDGKNLFAGDGYAGLSEFALYYIGGIIKHARALNAITNPGTNSYKRLVPGFEAPVKLAYSAKNRSASIRIPYVANPKGRRIEARFPDPLCNPYLGFAALLMAGLDGVENKIHPGEAATRTSTTCRRKRTRRSRPSATAWDRRWTTWTRARAFLTKGGVFTDSYIDAYIDLKMQEVTRFQHDDPPGRVRHVLLALSGSSGPGNRQQRVPSRQGGFGRPFFIRSRGASRCR